MSRKRLNESMITCSISTYHHTKVPSDAAKVFDDLLATPSGQGEHRKTHFVALSNKKNTTHLTHFIIESSD